MNNITNIFSVGISSYQTHGIKNDEIVKFIEENPCIDHSPKNLRTILNDNLFEDLNNLVTEKVNDYYHSIYNNKFKCRLIRAWHNHGNEKYIIEPHHHNQSFISAVYYPEASDAQIVFMNPNAILNAHQTDDMIGDCNPYNSVLYRLPIKTGELVIFNSMLDHYITFSKNKRMSIAYDAVVVK
tara:strand:- start:938 stop:1486 length:549 start_codon:yes stop_codon:yes gene_type:complete